MAAQCIDISVLPENKKAALFWIGLVLVLLASQIAVGVISVILATRDPSFSVVPDYHAKALNWDQVVQIRQASSKLGWQATIDVSSVPDRLGERSLIVHICDKSRDPMNNLQVNVTAYHHARASESVEGDMRFVGDGLYAIQLPMARDGTWEIEIHANGPADQHYEYTQTVNTLELTP
jgi:nitrogen fixation protein FixH